MRRFVLAIALLGSLASHASALPSKAPLVAFSVGPKEQAKPLLTELENQLKETKRFIIASPISFLGGDLLVSDAISKLRKLTHAEVVFAGNVSVAQGMELTGRIYDLTFNDVSKELRFRGNSEDLRGLARQLTLFLKSQYPLKGEVVGMHGQHVLLNLGAEDGVENGSLFTVTHRSGTEPSYKGTIKIISTEAWFSTGEVVPPVANGSVRRRRPEAWLLNGDSLTRKKESFFAPGDAAVEDVEQAMIKVPQGTP